MNSIIVLCAGKGTRMNNNKAKCLTKLIDKPFLAYINKTIKDLIGFNKHICVASYKEEDIINAFKDEFEFVHQDKLLGTGYALKCASEVLDDEGYSLIINGDMPLIESDVLKKLFLNHIKSKNSLTVLTTSKSNPSSYGRIVRDSKYNLLSIVEQSDLDLNTINNNEVNLGVYLIDNKVLKKYVNRITLNRNNEYYFTDIINILYKENLKIDSYKINDSYKYININDLYTLSIVEEALENEIRTNILKNGVELINKNTITIGEDVVIKKGTIIYPNNMILGTSVIEENVVLHANNTIINTHVGEASIIKDSYIENSIINKRVKIGPYAHLRQKNVVNDDVKIGNFVELKNVSLGKNTAASHLTYIGDTICGERVNFGCGVITVNYDGVNKHHTNIGNDVFIGCNTNLIAPLKIGNNAFIAAGSTITSSLSDYDFSIARSRQIIKKDYATKYKYNFKI